MCARDRRRKYECHAQLAKMSQLMLFFSSSSSMSVKKVGSLVEEGLVLGRTASSRAVFLVAAVPEVLVAITCLLQLLRVERFPAKTRWTDKWLT